MRATIVAIASVVALLVASCSAPAESRACDKLKDTIRALGTQKDPDPNRTVGELHECGRSAVPLMISELTVIDPEVVDDRWWHMVWCERGLRSITGQRFAFRSAEGLGTLAEFRAQDDELSYAMEWMSHARVYIAPRDVQARVIASWKDWIKQNDGRFEVARFESYGEWFW